jgi:uncharacterized protein (TIGR02466 family)
MNVTELNLFPTQIFTSKYACSLECEKFLSGLPMRNTPEEYNNQYGEYSNDTYVLKNEECSDLLRVIEDLAHNVMSDMMCMSVPEGVRVTQSWVSQKNPGEGHHSHVHPNSILSGVYYFDDGEDLAPIYFHKNSESNTFSLQVQMDNKKLSSKPQCWETFSLIPKKGMLILFPSHLHHSVGINTSNVSRKSLAFNIIPRNGFGTKGGLSELFVDF